MQLTLAPTLIIAFLANCLAAPSDFKALETDTNPSIENSSEIRHERVRRNVLVDVTKRWPSNTLCYRINSAFNASQKDLILNSMRVIQNQTNVRFVENLTKLACVSINPVPPGSGCASNVGFLNKPQTVTLPNVAPGTGCLTTYQVIHEFLHALGMHHQHNSHDRQYYVDIMWKNINPAQTAAFQQRPAGETTSFGKPYDYGSVMHYGRKISSANNQDTIVPKIDVEIGQRREMSPIDIQKLNIMYPPIGK